MKINPTDEWWMKMAELEGDSEIAAGALARDPLPMEHDTSALVEILHRIADREDKPMDVPWMFSMECAQAYAEHMNRWRVIADGEIPDLGDLVLLNKPSGELKVKVVTWGAGTSTEHYSAKDWIWKPINIKE